MTDKQVRLVIPEGTKVLIRSAGRLGVVSHTPATSSPTSATSSCLSSARRYAARSAMSHSDLVERKLHLSARTFLNAASFGTDS